jgi:hypothetical protein
MLARLNLIVGLILTCGPPLSAQPQPADEYRLKAAFVHRFTQFVEWPASALAGRSSFQFCVVRPNPFGAALQETVAGEVVDGLRLEVRDIDRPAQLDGCQVLFVPNHVRAAEPLLEEAARRNVLTVGESPGFLDEGGIITLRVVDRRLRFEVDTDAAARAGLRVSSQLLRLALAVRGVEP